MYFANYQAPFGKLGIVWDEANKIHYCDFHGEIQMACLRLKNPNILQAALPKFIKAALDDYFTGNIKALENFEICETGSEFQKKCWQALRKIPAGATISYAEEALNIKNPKAVRAVGGANNKNKIALFTPCHRVIGKDGSMVGFGGGIGVKEWLLAHEKKNAAPMPFQLS